MSQMYDEYLIEHKNNVKSAFYFLKDHLPEIFKSEDKDILQEVEHNVVYGHDISKNEPDEYKAYDEYFYGSRSFQVVKDFDRAWLLHIHRNPHHWQYWILIKDDPNEKETYIDMPDCYIIEMICDWWSFSWRSGELNEIFNWYNNHKSHIKLSDYTRNKVEKILELIKEKLKTIDDTLENILDEDK